MFDTTSTILLYEELFPVLVSLGVRELGMDASTAGACADEVFLASLRKLRQIEDPRSWLMAAMRAAGRTYVPRE